MPFVGNGNERGSSTETRTDDVMAKIHKEQGSTTVQCIYLTVSCK